MHPSYCDPSIKINSRDITMNRRQSTRATRPVTAFGEVVSNEVIRHVASLRSSATKTKPLVAKAKTFTPHHHYRSSLGDSPLKLKLSLTRSSSRVKTMARSPAAKKTPMKKTPKAVKYNTPARVQPQRKKVNFAEKASDSDVAIKSSQTKSITISTTTNAKSETKRESKKVKTEIRKRNKSLTKEEAIEEALTRLHSSAVPDSLPCRENQFQDIHNFIEQKLLTGEGGCMYISGVPGTGKTATVYEVKRALEARRDLPNFRFLEINGLRLAEPSKFSSHFLMQLTGENKSNHKATDILNERFTNGKSTKKFVILLVDEIDYLRTKKQEILYHIFDWPNHRNSRLIVLAIANFMNLPEQFMHNRVSSRLGLTRLVFQPYHFKELEKIVRSRLADMEHCDDIFESDALELVCRKVSAVSGDARRVLDICRRTLEITMAAGRVRVTMLDVDKALQEIFNSIKISRIRRASIQEQGLLKGVYRIYRATGQEEFQFIEVYKNHIQLCRLDGLYVPTTTELARVATNLDYSKIIFFEKSLSHLYRRIRLNVSPDDIAIALNIES